MDEPNVVEPEEQDVPDVPTPKSSPPNGNVGTKARKAGRAVKSAVKTSFKIARKVMQIFAALPLPVKIGVVVVIALVILVVVILEVEASESTEAFTESVDKVVEESETLTDEQKESYEVNGSLIKFPLEELLKMYDYYINEGEFAGQKIKATYKYVLGTNEVEMREGNSSTSGGDSSAVVDYDLTYTKGKDGVRDDKRVEYITGSTNLLKTYKKSNSYTWSNGKIGSVSVELENVDIKCWVTGGSTVTKTVQVNTKLAKVVKAMFEDIYNDPSKPIIDSIGGFRATDGSPGHPFGVAIDINPDQNPMPGTYGTMANYKPGVDSRSMDANHPIVKIIKGKYGWAWGGDFRSTKDYMHFSFWGG